MPHPPVAVPSAVVDDGDRCVTLSLDDTGRECVLRLDGTLDRGAVARVDAVLRAAEPLPWELVVDLTAARTRDRRLLRLFAEVAARRQDGGRDLVLRGAHADVVPDLEAATLPELFLVYRAVCRAPAAPGAPADEPVLAPPEHAVA